MIKVGNAYVDVHMICGFTINEQENPDKNKKLFSIKIITIGGKIVATCSLLEVYNFVSKFNMSLKEYE